MNLENENKNRQNGDQVDEFVQNVMHSLDDVKMASPTPFFFTRVKSRLENKNLQRHELKWLKPFYQSQWSLVSLILLLIINIGVFIYSHSQSDVLIGQTTNAELLIDEYQLEYISLYSYIED